MIIKSLRHTYLLSLLSFGITFSGCSFGSESAPPDVDGLPVRAEVIIGRASLEKSEFEQYKFFASNLYWECGLMKGGRNFPKEQKLVPLDEDQRDLVASRAKALFDQSVQFPETYPDTPGNAQNLFDPGKAIVTVQVGEQKVDIKTSFDAVEQGGTNISSKTLELVKELRNAAGTPPCGNTDFYGISIK